ncbi:protein FAM136A-like [Adelges cooleyi]|uniref:protein FAM136A-like n=1 Tax=Adelges cooleyi TaxID=133065 RepID=UPI00217F66F0|nr:protein FAM136A-like [Adelges cooleyi]XP_050426492.1 protein FAM136A-like [Adelges cooleyi]
MDEEQRRMESAVNNALNDIDKKCLRKLQIQMHQCSIDCCKDTSININSLKVCVDNCAKDVVSSQNYLQNEFSKWQHRIQRCVQDCQDTISDNMTGNPSESQISKYTKEAEACMSRCFTKHINLLPQLTEKIVSTLNNR